MSTNGHNFPTVNIFEARALLRDAIKAQVNVLFVGPPGVGKTAVTEAVVAELAQELADESGSKEPALRLGTIIAATLDPTDIGGFPVVDPGSGAFRRVPMQILRDGVDHRHVYFWDEISNAPGAVEAPLLRVLLANVAGDTALHPDTAHVAACNPPEQTAGGRELSAALRGRFALYNFRPTVTPDRRGGRGEVFDYFNDRLGSQPGELGTLARDFAATLLVRPDLVELDPPEQAIVGMDTWGAPRNWERALRHGAILGSDPSREKLFDRLAGSVGASCAQAYLAIRDLRAHLPSVDAVCVDPANALLPTQRDIQIGALGLLAEVSNHDVWAAWIYASRLHDEVGAACALALMPRDTGKAPKKHATAGNKARLSLCGRIGNYLK